MGAGRQHSNCLSRETDSLLRRPLRHAQEHHRRDRRCQEQHPQHRRPYGQQSGERRGRSRYFGPQAPRANHRRLEKDPRCPRSATPAKDLSTPSNAQCPVKTKYQTLPCYDVPFAGDEVGLKTSWSKSYFLICFISGCCVTCGWTALVVFAVVTHKITARNWLALF